MKNDLNTNGDTDTHFPPPIDQRILRDIITQWDREFKASVEERLDYNELTICGKLLTYKHVRKHRKHKKRGVRGKVYGMSNASRLRLLKKLATWDWNAIEWSLFITLTYPDERAMPLREERNVQRFLFHRRLEEELDAKVPCLWRVEYEVRESGQHLGKPCPHWHLLLPSVRWIDKDHINGWWRRVIDWKGYARTETVGATKAEGAAMYIGKYLSKAASSNSLVYASYHNDSGRPWGILRPEKIPVCETFIFERLTDVESEWLRQFAEQFLPSVDARVNTSFTLLGTLADDCCVAFMKKRVDKLQY